MKIKADHVNAPQWKEVTVKSKLPEQLKCLDELAHNMWWAWNYEARDLWRSLDEELYEEVGHNPVLLLEQLSYERKEEIVKDKALMKRVKDVYALFHKYMNKPLYLENDGNCAAVGEYYAGAGRRSKRFVTITLGTGVGAGIIHNGKIYHGANGMAGEVGHMVIEQNGLPCPCGRHGCWEQYASATALKRMTAEALAAYPDSILARVITENDGHVSGQSAFIAAREGDPVGQMVCDRYVDYLACGVVNVVNIFQPDTLAIGGGVSNEADEQLLLPVQQRVARESIPCGKDRRTRIVKAQLGNRAGLIGAALLGKNKRI